MSALRFLLAATLAASVMTMRIQNLANHSSHRTTGDCNDGEGLPAGAEAKNFDITDCLTKVMNSAAHEGTPCNVQCESPTKVIAARARKMSVAEYTCTGGKWKGEPPLCWDHGGQTDLRKVVKLAEIDAVQARCQADFEELDFPMQWIDKHMPDWAGGSDPGMEAHKAMWLVREDRLDPLGPFKEFFEIIGKGVETDAWQTRPEGTCKWAQLLLDLVTKWGFETFFDNSMMTMSTSEGLNATLAVAKGIAQCTCPECADPSTLGGLLCSWAWPGAGTPVQTKCPGFFDGEEYRKQHRVRFEAFADLLAAGLSYSSQLKPEAPEPEYREAWSRN